MNLTRVLFSPQSNPPQSTLASLYLIFYSTMLCYVVILVCPEVNLLLFKAFSLYPSKLFWSPPTPSPPLLIYTPFSLILHHSFAPCVQNISIHTFLSLGQINMHFYSSQNFFIPDPTSLLSHHMNSSKT